MRWRWIDTPEGAVLGLEAELPGVSEFGFLGRTRPGMSALGHRDLVRLGQVHGKRVVEARAPGPIASCDGAWTRTADVLLTVRTADCLPVLIADESRIALLHAGWRGLAAGILEEGLSLYGGRIPARIVIGPAVGVCCYEVGPEVAAQFPGETLRPGPRGRPYLDLFKAAVLRLTERGVPAGHIVTAPFCTRCHQHLLASARGSGGGPERIIAFAGYRSDSRP